MPQAEFGEPELAHAPLSEPGVESILREVIAESAQRLTDASTLPASVLDRFRELAARHPTTPFAAEPIGRAMVEIVLREFFRLPAYSSLDRWDDLCTRVTEALCDHTASRTRLEEFWARLQSEAVQALLG